MSQSSSATCGVKRCRRVVRQAFDVWNPWPDGKGENRRHYEVCDEHAAEYWPDGTGYLKRDQAGRIAARIVSTPPPLESPP